MRKYRKWVVTLGIVAAAPHVAQAGAFGWLKPKAEADAAFNQQVAQGVADKLQAARLKGGSDINIEFQGGTLSLTGRVADAATKSLASQLASGVEGVRSVDNRMTYATGNPDLPGVPATAAAPAGGPVRQVSGESLFGAKAPVQSAAFETAPTAAPSIEQVAAARRAAQQRAAAPAAPMRTAVRPARPQASPMPPAATVRPVSMEAPASGTSSQETADQIAAALGRAGLSGYDIQIRCSNGVCTLGGSVASPQQRDAAVQIAQACPSVSSVECGIAIAPPAPNVRGMNYQNGEAMGEAAPAPPAGYPGAAPGYAPPGYGMPPQYGMQPGYGMPPGAVPPPPGYANAGPGAVSPVYDQPNLPQYAWPTYAAPNNYAALTYPKQYSASAWPYIGPFYPYPQVPLGWRSVTMEWDDGQWYLDFNDRTDRWWWFMNPKNW